MHVDTLTDHSCSAESDGEKASCRVGDLGSDARDKCDDEDHDLESDERQRGPHSPKPVTSSPLTGVEAPILNQHLHHHHHHHLHHLQHLHNQREDLTRNIISNNDNKSSSCLDNRITSSSGASQNPTVKPKLWSLAEIATSDQKHQQQQQHIGQPNCPTPTTTSPAAGAVYPATSILGRPIYYTSPFYSNYTNYGNFSPLQGQGILRYNSSGMSVAAAAAAAANEGLSSAHQAAAAAAALEATLHKQNPDSPLVKTNPNQIVVEQQQHFRPANFESKKGT